MTPTPTPPAPADDRKMQLAKMVGGTVVAVCCFALVALNHRLGIGLEPDMCSTLILAGMASSGVAGHGALMTPVKS